MRRSKYSIKREGQVRVCTRTRGSHPKGMRFTSKGDGVRVQGKWMRFASTHEHEVRVCWSSSSSSGLGSFRAPNKYIKISKNYRKIPKHVGIKYKAFTRIKTRKLEFYTWSQEFSTSFTSKKVVTSKNIIKQAPRDQIHGIWGLLELENEDGRFTHLGTLPGTSTELRWW